MLGDNIKQLDSINRLQSLWDTVDLWKSIIDGIRYLLVLQILGGDLLEISGSRTRSVHFRRVIGRRQRKHLLHRLVHAARLELPNSVVVELRLLGPLALDARSQGHIGVHDEIGDYMHPTRVLLEVIVVLGRDLADLGQIHAAHKGEVVVLDVVTDVEREHVDRAVIARCLLSLSEHIVVRDVVASQRMKKLTNEKSTEQERDRLPAAETAIDDIECQLNDKIRHLEIRDCLRIDGEWPEGVEDWLEEHPQGLSRGGRECVGLPLRRNVRVDHILAQVPMVLQVVLLEGDRHRNQHRKICDETEEAVCEWSSAAVCLVVRDLENCECECVVDCSSDEICLQPNESPVGIYKSIREDDVDQDHGNNGWLESGIRPEQLLDLRVLGEHLATPGRVGLLIVRPNELLLSHPLAHTFN
ncbi:hypothetical protein PENTCL1PPCAC_19179, partial [Pristionchus entomophagus]